MKVDPSVLRQLRHEKRLSQEQLAAKAKIDKQTISRLERGSGERTRDHTLRQLARALNTESAVLSGEAPPPDRQRDAEQSKSQFNISVHAGARNALFLIAERYHVRPWQVLELAPFLFCWAAEASLRQRHERLEEVERACENARNAENAISHLPLPDFTYSEEKIAAEKESIEGRDLFANWVENNDNLTHSPFPHDPGGGYDNPFARFLSNLVLEFDTSITFEEFAVFDSPIYKVCKEEAAYLVEGESELADAVLQGDVALWDMPKEIRDDYRARAQWIRTKAIEKRNNLLEQIKRTNDEALR
jgi:transcriptional regulator with XRE-family HTH domain